MAVDDVWHLRVRDWFAVATASCLVPVTVVQETAYLVGGRLGAQREAEFLRGMTRGEFELLALADDDLVRAADLVEVYADFPLGFVDASIVAIAERLDVRTLLTTDRRHFTVVRPVHVPRFVLAP